MASRLRAARGVTAVVVCLAVTGCGSGDADRAGDRSGRGTRTTLVARVVDGDTVVTESGAHVRIIGVDTPERGSCGYEQATAEMRRLVEREEVELVDPGSVQDADTYGRLLRYVDVAGRDAGLAQIRAGWATARYDSRDGYDPHPREDRYRAADRQHSGPCAS